MSFWSDLGEKAKDGVVGAFDAVRAQADLFNRGTEDSAIAHAVQPVVQPATNAIMWTGNQADHLVGTAWAVGDITADSGANPLSKDSWKQAWAATEDFSGFGMWGRAASNALAFKGAPDLFTGKGVPTAEYAEYNKSAVGQFTNGAMEVMGTWYADPTIVLGKAAKIARVANTIEDAAKAEEVSKAFTAGNLAENVDKGTALRRGKTFSTSTDETATRLAQTIAKTDNMTVNEVATTMKPLLVRSGNAAPVVDLLGQAGKITDLTVQRQVKADVLLAAAGSHASRDRLIENAPDIARAMQRRSSAPPEFAILDDLSKNTDQLYASGSSLTAAARKLGQDTGNKKEIVRYGKDLDRIHRHFRDLDQIAEVGGVERVGLTALDRAKIGMRGNSAEFYYQDAVSGRTIRFLHLPEPEAALHWATGQRSRGTVATNDAFRGHEELMDQLTRSKLFTGAERAKVSEKWWSANDQSLRNKVVDDLWEDMIRRANAVADVPLDEAEIGVILKKVVAGRAQGRKYVTAQMEEARAAGHSRVTLEDPPKGSATTVDSALLEKHLRNTVPLPDTDLIQRTLQHAAGTRGTSQSIKDVLADITDASNPINDWWRLAVLARPGLFVRTQLDTQARATAMMGITNIVANTMTGLGHKFGAKLSREDLVHLGARAEDELERTATLRQAAKNRRDAQFLSGDAGQRLLDRAAELEEEAARPIQYLDDQKYLGSSDLTIEHNGVRATTRATTSKDDRLAVWDATLPGDATMSDLLTNLSGKANAKLVEDAGNWITHAPDSPEWVNGWLRSTDVIRTSYTGRKILREADHPTVDLISSLRHDPKVRENWREVRFDNPDFDDWLDRVRYEVEWMAPTRKTREALLEGNRLSPEQVDGLFVNRGESTKAVWDQARLKAGQATVKAKRDLLAHQNKRATTDPAIQAKRLEKQKKLEAVLAENKAKVDALESTPPAQADGLADRMFVHAPAHLSLNEVQPKKSLANVARKAIQIMSDQPDVVLARHPLYVHQYMKHFEGLFNRAVERGDITGTGKLTTEAQVRIEKMARHRAIQDVQQTMYDTARYTGAHAGVMRMVSPFLNAWEDAMMSWSRLMYDDPKVLGALVKTWNIPERMGLIHDQDGNIVKPGEKAEQKFVAIPLGAAGKFIGVKELQLRKDSWNSIFQGETWWQPGYGPIVTVPAQQIATRAWPKIADPNGPAPKWMQPFIRSAINGDAPKVRPGVKGGLVDAGQGFLPSWLAKGLSAFDPTAPAYTNVFQDSMNSQVVAMREQGKEPTKADWDRIRVKAEKAARNTAIVKAVALGGFGQSAEGNGIAKFYSDQYNAIQKNAESLPPGKTPEQVFNERFPEAAGLPWSVSFTDTGINAYIETEDRAKTFSKEIENPATREYGWFYAGNDNVGGTFSPSVYNAQSSRRSGPGTSVTQRRRQSPEDMLKRNQVSLGWAEFQRVQTKIDNVLQSRGLHSLNQKGAEDLAEIKRTFVAQLSADNPTWGKDHDSFDPGVLDRFITNAVNPMLSDPRAKNRSDIKLMGQYLDYRAKAQALAEKNGYSLTSQQGAPLRAVLDQVGSEYAQQDTGFMQAWQRMFSREVEDGN